MDRRIETLVRRDQNGRPLPPTQAEIANWSANYGASKTQAAVREIQEIQDKARAQEQAAGESALKAEQARAAIEAAKAQAVIAKQKADQEAAAQAAQTEKARLANQSVEQKQQAAETYHHSPLGIGMAGLEGASPPAGFLGGLGLSKGINYIQEKSRKNANLERQNIASDFDKINPSTATAADYESIPRAARQANVIPKTGPMANFTRGIGRYSPYVGVGAFMAGEGALQRYLANRDDSDMDPFVKDAFNTTGAAMMGAGLGTMGKGLVYAGSPTERPDASALRKIALAEGKAKELAAGEAKEALPPPPAQVEPYKGNPKDVARYIAHDLGLTPNAKDTKADLIDRALGQIKSGYATPEQLDLVKQRARGVAPEAILERLAGTNKALAAILAATGIGAAAAVTAPNEAKAATPRAAAKPKPEETSSDLSDLEREYGTGLPKGATGEALKGAADAASYAIPGVGEARMAAEAPNLYNPSDEDLADTEYWQRGREEMAQQAQPHASGGPAFNPEHLPKHEQSLVDNPHEALERAFWQLPYMAAGRHMVELTGDPNSFFGGHDPETEAIYQNTLAASKAFYGDAFKRLSNKAPTADEAPTQPEAPVAKKHGGAVARKIASIHSHFETRLKNKERHVVSLERAHSRSGNAKLTKKLNEEKNNVKNIKEHLQNIQKYRKNYA